MINSSLLGLVNNSIGENDEEILSATIEEDTTTKKKKNRGHSKEYFLAETFPSLELAKAAIESEGTWSLKNKSSLKKTQESKIFYRCNKVVQRNPIQCSTGLVLILKADSQEVEVHRTLCAHDHIARVFSVSIETREEIQKMLSVTDALSPAKILLNLENINEQRSFDTLNVKPLLQIPLLRDLYNYLTENRKKIYLQTNNNLVVITKIRLLSLLSMTSILIMGLILI